MLHVGGKQVKDASGLSLKHLLIGSEGTLAVITKCLLRLLPKPETTVSVLVPFADLGTGIRSVLTILQANATRPQSSSWNARWSRSARSSAR